jgi:flavin-dependent dehydrogenase
MPDDVLIVGAGPAGSIAALVLARAGVRVRLLDRATFPRDKLCGDTINPGTMALLRRLGIAEAIERQSLPVDGMVVSGEGGITIDGRYPAGLHGRSIRRRDLDWILLRAATDAGAAFEADATVRGAALSSSGVDGVRVGGDGNSRTLHAPVTLAADGRHSTITFGLGLARHPREPRRWAIGAYFQGVPAIATRGEMHIRRGRYIGLAPTPDGLVNVCVVRPLAHAGAIPDASRALREELLADSELGPRIAEARMATRPVVLGPLAVDVRGEEALPPGLLLAGDAAGFIDPMTGDGLRFAVRGGELAAAAALRALEHGWTGVHLQNAADRRREFAPKWRFNRALRALVSSPGALRAAALGARVAPGTVRALIARAGDCDLA